MPTCMASFVPILLLPLLAVSAQSPARPCNATDCQLPTCRCASTDIPGNLPIYEVPQMVTLNFDDSVRVYDYDNYYSNVFSGRKNPNNCQIGITFFTSHSYTDYSLVEHAFYNEGYEFASHSVTHRWPTTWWKEASELELKHEILDQKSILCLWGGIPSNKIRGFRAPFLETSENELKVLHENGFLYESSMGSYTHYWPFTLDYKSPLCTPPSTCPVNSYPGLWIVPNVIYIQSNGRPCIMLDACTAPITEDQWFELLEVNFYAHYHGNRSPFGIHAHAAAWFFLRPERVNAMNRFLDKIGSMSDVYVVTQTQALEWVRNPTPLSQIQSFAPWQCPNKQSARCSFRNPTCVKTFYTPLWSQLKTCTSPCPTNYPGYANPQGD